MSRPRTVLVIEDEAGIRRSIGAYLEDSGYIVLEAANGREAIELFARTKPDIVLTDLRMPEMNGIEVIAWLRIASPRTPVIVLTGTSDKNARAAALGDGVRECIEKPIDDLAELEAAIERAFHLKNEP